MALPITEVVLGILAVSGFCLGIALVAGYVLERGLSLRERRRLARSLRGDWWPRFERELDEYVARQRSPARERGHNR